MYDDHYGLSGRPFQLTPDPRFWFDTATHRKAMAYLGYGLAQGEGFIVITGDVGAGKTTLVGHLMDTVDAERLHVIKIVSTQIEAEDLLRMVAGGLGVDSDGLTKAQLLVAIERGLHATARAGRRTLLIVDEAQALPVSSLEELRMLSNFQTGGHALLQIFLLGQPEFRERLHGSDRLEQLRQRVIAMHHLDPMEREEVEPYMRHRLSVVGWTGRPHFTPDAYAALYVASDGVPRRLNQLAGRVLLFGAIEQLDRIDGRAVATVVADIAGDMPGVTPIAMPEAAPVVAAAPPPPREEPRPLPIYNAPPPAEPRPIRAVRDEPAPAPTSDVNDHIAALEARINEQDIALRRMLAMLVDWAEGDERPDLSSLRAGGAEVMRHGMSVDVEDWFQVGAFETVIDKSDWDTLTPRVARNTDAVLDLFAESGVKATFFTLGWVAERNPALIRRIVEQGHELASHGWDHDRVFTMDAAAFRADLARARGTLEDAGGVAVTGYRAPSFSIDPRTPWAHRVLAEEGYAYSSSVAPLKHDHYGWPEAPRFAFRPLADAELVEVPVTVAEFGTRRMATGGGFFRLFPAALTDYAVRQVAGQGQPAVFYFHPWEIDPGQPRVVNAPAKSKLRHYSRLGAMAGKLRGLIARHDWGRMDEIVRELDPQQAAMALAA